jgi:kinesin family protein 5
MDKQEEPISGNIQVVCRFRPFTETELEYSMDPLYHLSEDHKTISILSQYDYSGQLEFTFDNIFEPDCSQIDLFQASAQPIVDAIMQGVNGTIFAYGQTSSGKTYTMTGPDLLDPEHQGLIPRMVFSIFDSISNSDPCIEFTVKVSYCEIYLEKIRDLLNVNKNNLKIHEDRTRGVFIAELTEKYVSDAREVFEIMKVGLDNRVVGCTNMNQQSSRSHSLFSLTVSQTNSRDFIAKTGKLYLVDLAGSEKVAKTSSCGIRLEEAKNINKSLTMLGLVINSLTDGKSTHIPYRDSKLTRVLQDSLGGNSKTSLIITCSPSVFNEAETISTLRFGIRAKCIKNKPKVNRDFTIAELKIMLGKCREELSKKDKYIQKLETRLASNSSKVENPGISREDSSVSTELEEIKHFSYDEVIGELELLKERLSKEVKHSDKVQAELISKDDQLSHQLAVTEVLEKKNLDFKSRTTELEKNLREKNEALDKFEVVKETLEKELLCSNTKVLELERILSEKEVAQSPPPIAPSKSGLEELKSLLSMEKEESKAKNQEITDLRSSLNQMLNKKSVEYKVQEAIKNNIARKEREKWADERRSILKDLQVRIERIIELELSLDDSRQAYKNLEGMMSEGERALKRKTDALERNLEQLTLMYHSLVTQKSQISVEKSLAEKKFSRVSETIKTLNSEVERYRDLYEKTDQKCSILTQEIAILQKNKGKFLSVPGNCVKTIQGGRKNS